MRNIKSRVMRILPDKAQLQLMYFKHFKRFIHFRNPKTFNEKIQWLKLNDRNPEYTKLVDKYEVKQYIADTIGSEYVIPTLGVWERVEDINFDSLPDQFVLKCTHDSGSIAICKDKATFDKKAAIKLLNNGLKRNGCWFGCEWPYKNVKPRIIAETYMEDPDTAELRDYKFFCFNGEAKLLFIATDRQAVGTETKFDFFDMDFNHLDIKNGHPNADILPQKPMQFDKMVELAEKLSIGFPHLRVDFYEVNGKIYFGELTFSHWSGFVPFEPPEWDETLGSWIQLPE